MLQRLHDPPLSGFPTKRAERQSLSSEMAGKLIDIAEVGLQSSDSRSAAARLVAQEVLTPPTSWKWAGMT